MGKAYTGAREDLSDAIGSSHGGVSIGTVYSGDGYRRAGGDVSSAEGNEAATGAGAVGNLCLEESPMQRLVRLREETALLADDLEEMSKVRMDLKYCLRGVRGGEWGSSSLSTTAPVTRSIYGGWGGMRGFVVFCKPLCRGCKSLLF